MHCILFVVVFVTARVMVTEVPEVTGGVSGASERGSRVVIQTPASLPSAQWSINLGSVAHLSCHP